MNLKNLASKPQLIKITLDDEDIVEKYGEAVEFWVYDKQPIEKFVKFAGAGEQDYGLIIEFCSDLILDSEGNKVMVDGLVLPAHILMKCVNKVVEQLGK